MNDEVNTPSEWAVSVFFGQELYFHTRLSCKNLTRENAEALKSQMDSIDTVLWKGGAAPLMTLSLPSSVTLTHQAQPPHGVTHNHLSQA